MNNLIIRGGRVLIPSRQFDGAADILVEKGVVSRIAPRIAAAKKGEDRTVVDASGLWVMPGLVDLHTHLREPGFEYKETLASGTAAAAAGGFTSILCMANTNPVNDNAAVTRYILKRAQETGVVRVYPVGAVTIGLAGENLSEMVDMAENGCVAFSDDGRPVGNSFLFRKALEYLRYKNGLLISHAEDLELAAGGSCHEGKVGYILGLKGIPAAAEEVMVARDIILSRLTGGRVHLAHLSTRGSARLAAGAREEGLPITSEVTPHHLFLTDESLAGYDTDTKVNPPLREEADRQALLSALREGIIDCIASDHAPHGLVDKEVEYDQAAFGISGIETSLPLCLRLVHEGFIPPLRLVELMSTRPAAIAGIPAGDLAPGAAADITLVDPDLEHVVDPGEFLSRGRNTPFKGWRLRGRAVLTLVGGRKVHSHPSVSGRLEGPSY